MANKKRLIDADALRQTIESKIYWGGVGLLEAIDEAPAVDAVEVVRCKDCKHYDNSEGICWCRLNSRLYPGGADWHSFPEDGFCSYGERRTDND